MADPRVARTRERVIGTVRDLLSDAASGPPTFSTIAEAAGVSRKTLYAHWDSPAQLIRDMLLEAHSEIVVAPDAGHAEILRSFLADVRNSVADPAVHAGVAYLVQAATHDADAADTLRGIGAGRAAEIGALLGTEVTQRQLALAVGPLFFTQLFTGAPADDAMIDGLVRRW